MRKSSLVSKCLLTILFSTVTAVYAQSSSIRESEASKTEGALDFAVLKETLPIRLDALKESIQRSNEDQSKRLEVQDKRIGDINSSVDRFGNLLTVFGLLLTLLALFFSFGAWWSAGIKAIEATRVWLKANEAELTLGLKNDIDSLKSEVEILIRKNASEAEKQIEKKLIEVDRITSEAVKRFLDGLQKKEGMVSSIYSTQVEVEVTDVDINDSSLALEKNILDVGNGQQEPKSVVKPDSDSELSLEDKNRLEKIKQQVRDAAIKRKSEPVNAIKIYDEIISTITLSDEIVFRRSLIYAFNRKASVLSEIEKYDDAAAVDEIQANKFKDESDSYIRKYVAIAMLNRGIRLKKSGNLEASISSYDALLLHFPRDDVPAIKIRISKAFLYKGAVLRELKKFDFAIEVYRDLIETYSSDNNQEVLEQVVRAMIASGLIYGNLDRPQDEINIYDDVISRFGKIKPILFPTGVATALLNKGIVLSNLKRWNDSVISYNNLLDLFIGVEDLIIQRIVADAIFNKGYSLGQLGQSNEEIFAYDDVITLFAKSNDSEIVDSVTRAYLNKALTYGQQNKLDKELITYEAMIARYADIEEIGVRTRVGQSFMGKAEILIKRNDDGAALQAIEQLIDILKTATHPELLMLLREARDMHTNLKNRKLAEF